MKPTTADIADAIIGFIGAVGVCGLIGWTCWEIGVNDGHKMALAGFECPPDTAITTLNLKTGEKKCIRFWRKKA